MYGILVAREMLKNLEAGNKSFQEIYGVFERQ